jgi:hypothetical protein
MEQLDVGAYWASHDAAAAKILMLTKMWWHQAAVRTGEFLGVTN